MIMRTRVYLCFSRYNSPHNFYTGSLVVEFVTVFKYICMQPICSFSDLYRSKTNFNKTLKMKRCRFLDPLFSVTDPLPQSYNQNHP
jgi:hypothetical protein